jgi:hypothetical protein
MEGGIASPMDRIQTRGGLRTIGEIIYGREECTKCSYSKLCQDGAGVWRIPKAPSRRAALRQSRCITDHSLRISPPLMFVPTLTLK